MAGYMYLFDSDVMEEELKFEELLTRVINKFDTRKYNLYKTRRCQKIVLEKHKEI